MNGYTYSSFNYGPVFLIFYGVFYLLNIDIRVLNLLFYLIMAIWLVKEKRIGLVNYFIYLIFLFNPWVLYLILTNHIFYYGVILLILNSIKTDKKLFLSSVLSTIAVMTRQFALPIIFFKWLGISTNKNKIVWASTSLIIIILMMVSLFGTEWLVSLKKYFVPVLRRHTMV